MSQHSGTVCAKKRPTQVGRYGRIPKEVLEDKRLSDGAVRIYGVLAMWVFQGNVARKGVRDIANKTGKSRTTVHRRIQELIQAGYVIAGEVSNGKRAYYSLTSGIFGQKQRAGVEEVVWLNERPRRVSVGAA